MKISRLLSKENSYPIFQQSKRRVIKESHIILYELFLDPLWLKITTAFLVLSIVVFDIIHDLHPYLYYTLFRILRRNKIYIPVFNENMNFKAIQRL